MFIAATLWTALTTEASYVWPLGFVIGCVITFVVTKSTFSKEVSAEKDDLIDTRGKKITDLQDEIQRLKDRDEAQQQLIDQMRKELDEWKRLPIRSLSENYDLISKYLGDMLSTQNQILEAQNTILKNLGLPEMAMSPNANGKLIKKAKK